MAITLTELLSDCVLKKEEVDRFLDPSQPNWARFDGEVGYLLRDSFVRDGIDKSYTLAHYEPTGERRSMLYADRPCRINTYGDSFTQCQQASDGETWQTYLAAHFGEPIRNFGVGGHGAYQAYRRMLRQEEITPAPYVILNIFGVDDHVRSFDRWRWIRIRDFREELRTVAPFYFHGNPWSYARLDLDTGEVKEFPQLCPTPESLYRLCEFDFVYAAFKDDFQAHITLAREGGKDFDGGMLARMAQAVGVKPDLTSAEAAAKTARRIQVEYGFAVSKFVVRKAAGFARETGRKLMILLSYDEGSVAAACKGQARLDQGFVDFLEGEGVAYVDSLVKHVEDFTCFRMAPEQYVSRYYMGHYRPRGNHFFAFVIKDSLVEWLDPKPVTYSGGAAPAKDTANW